VIVDVREAVAADAEAACEVLRRSIAELCTEDHGDDAAILQRWLSNKQPEIFRQWLVQPGNAVLVATDGDRILAVGAVTDAGEITLNYVSPDVRFQGVSRTLLAALEQRARDRGNALCTLSSTATARRFYRANGYADTGPPKGNFGTQSGFPMQKDLG
jgi:GNAT superfamily N-acetyltransferase